MKKLFALLIAVFMVMSLFAQTNAIVTDLNSTTLEQESEVLMPFAINGLAHEGFEGLQAPSLPAGWTILNADAMIDNWEIFNNAQFAHNGQNFAASFSDADFTIEPDNFLILPPITISTGDYLNFCAAAHDISETLSVVIFKQQPVDTNFHATLYTRIFNTDWRAETIDLSNYVGQEIYIAFRHHNCIGRMFIKVDDVSVGAASSINKFENNEGTFTIYPNPANDYINVEAASTIKTIRIYNIVGQEVMNEEIAANMVKINVADLIQGVYVMAIETEKGIVTRKVNIK